MQNQEKAVRRATMWLVLFQILSFCALASMNYHNVYLKEIGFDARQIGIWGSAAGIVAMVTLPVWGVVSDKTRSGKLTFVLSMLVYGLIYALIPLTGRWFGAAQGLSGGAYFIRVLPIYLLLALYGTIKQSTRSLQDAFFVSNAVPLRINYPFLRMWGALGFGVLCILIGIFVDYTGVPFIFYLGTAFCIAFAVFALPFRNPAMEQQAVKRPQEKMRPWVLFGNYYYVASLIILLCLSMYHGLTISFYPYILEHAGVAPDKFGIISGYGALVQAVLMFVLDRWAKNVPPQRLLMIAGVVAVLENVTYAIADGMGMMFLAGTFWGIEIGLNVCTLPRFVYMIVPEKYATTAQTFNGTVTMTLCVIGTVTAGYLIAAVGISVFNLIVAGLCLVLTALFVLSIPFGEKVLHITPPWKE